MPQIHAYPASAPVGKEADSLPSLPNTTTAVEAMPCSLHQQAEQLLQKIGCIKRENQQLERELQTRVQALAERAKAQKYHLQTQITRLTKQLEAMVEQKPEWFKHKRSVQFFYGRLGYRKSTAITPVQGQSMHDVLCALQKFHEHEAVITQKKVDLRVLHGWNQSRLRRVGAVRAHNDRFWVESF